MTTGFFLSLRSDVQHFLHAASLVAEVHRRMPGVEVIQLSDKHTPVVPGVTGVSSILAENESSLLDLRLSLYASREGEWLLIDTDVSIRNDVRGVFADESFDVALCDRNWPHLAQGEKIMHTMPFNTGVVFTRRQEFWQDVLAHWRALPLAVREDWMSEQRAVYAIVRTGRYHVKILPGMAYNYPPGKADDAPIVAACVHYKGNRKKWLSAHANDVLGGRSCG